MADELPHGLGRLAAPDARDRRFLMRDAVFPHPELLPRPRKRPYNLGPTLDQGRAPMCVGFSARDKLASAPIMVHNDQGPTPIQIYDGAQQNDEWEGTNYDGTSVRGAFKYLQAQGYLASYVWAASVTDCERYIRDGYGTIVLGTDWREGMFEVDQFGFCRVEGDIVGGHAYHLFWMDPVKREAWCKNSWGPNWGITLHARPGCFKLTYEALDVLLADQGEAGAAVEIKVR